jgi:hypothetical protein
LASAGLEQDDLDAAPRQLVGERPAAGSGTDDDDRIRVILGYLGHVILRSESASQLAS